MRRDVFFVKIYMTLCKEVWTNNNFNNKLNNDFTVVEIKKPSYSFYRKRADSVGSTYGWHLRPRVQDENFINSLTHADQAMFFTFHQFEKEIGYCLIEEPNGSDIEISDFGFPPQHKGKGLGKIFLPKMINICFDTHKDVKNVVLSTRSTNDSRVPDFYKLFGFKISHTEEVKDILLPPDKIFLNKIYE